MSALLSSEKLIAKIDRQNMRAGIAGFSRQFTAAFDSIDDSPKLFVSPGVIRNIVFAGVGGSAIAADFVRWHLASTVPVPVIVHRNYGIPFFTGEETLVVVVSYSGDTEECLSAVHEALWAKAKCLVVASGGELERIARKKSVPFIKVMAGLPPRVALGYLIMAILRGLEAFEVTGSLNSSEWRGIAARLEELNKKRYGIHVPLRRNQAKQLALRCKGKIPVVYAPAGFSEAAALRWRCQFEENSKTLAFHHTIPDMNHNEIVAWPGKETKGKFIIFFLRDRDDHERIGAAMHQILKILKTAGHEVMEIFSDGACLSERMLSLIHLGDWISFYLAILKKVDPTPIPAVQMIKANLAKQKLKGRLISQSASINIRKNSGRKPKLTH